MQLFSLKSLVVLAALVCTAGAIKCYIGIKGSDTTISCSGSCTKTTKSDNDDNAVLACLPTRHEEKCSQLSSRLPVETCYCNTDYCNTSSTSLPSLLLFIPLLFSFLLPHVY